MKNPTISIIMSSYNDERYIALAIESVLKQKYQDWEFIIINDDSTDNTENIIQKYASKDRRIHLISNENNKGLVANLVKGVDVSKGKYIARIDGDDIWVSTYKLEKQIEFLENNSEYSLIGSWANIVDEQGKLQYKTKNPNTDKEIRNYILIENCFFHSSVLIRKSTYEKAGGYNLKIKTSEDYDLWLKIGKISKMFNIGEYMIGYRNNSIGINATKYDFQLKETINLIHKYKNFYPNYKLGLMLWYSRRFVPKKIRVLASSILKNKLIIGQLRLIKKTFLSINK